MWFKVGFSYYLSNSLTMELFCLAYSVGLIISVNVDLVFTHSISILASFLLNKYLNKKRFVMSFYTLDFRLGNFYNLVKPDVISCPGS